MTTYTEDRVSQLERFKDEYIKKYFDIRSWLAGNYPDILREYQRQVRIGDEEDGEY